MRTCDLSSAESADCEAAENAANLARDLMTILIFDYQLTAIDDGLSLWQWQNQIPATANAAAAATKAKIGEKSPIRRRRFRRRMRSGHVVFIVSPPPPTLILFVMYY